MMISSLKPKSGDTSKVVTENTQQAMRLVTGLRMLDFEMEMESQLTKQCSLDSLARGQAEETEISRSTFGIPTSSTSLRLKGTNESSDFTVRQSGSIGQEIFNSDGDVVAWTVDEEFGSANLPFAE